MLAQKERSEKDLSLKPKSNLPGRVYTIIVPVLGEDLDECRVRLALDLAHPYRGRVVLVGLVRVPLSESLSVGVARAQNIRAVLDRLRLRFEGYPIYIRPRVRVVHDPWRSLAKSVAQDQADLLIIPWPARGVKPLLGLKMVKLLSQLECHVIMVTASFPDKLRRILLALRGGPDAMLTLDMTLSLAGAAQSEVTLLYQFDDKQDALQQVYKELSRMRQGNPLIKREIRVEGQLTPAIIEQAGQYDLTIIGAADVLADGDGQVLGQAPYQLRRANIGPLLIVKTHQMPSLENLTAWVQHEPLPLTPTSVLVDKWFAENTFSSQEFENLEYLVQLKQKHQYTISLGLPALNEEETIGAVIQTMQNTLVRQVPLLDEIVLIDSGSTDYTVDIALDLGIPVYQHTQILPQYGAFRGKGEALWKSLYVLKGDIIAWVDTDIVNIHPRFVYGILGPLLRQEAIQYVKGFYRRPLKVGDTLQAGGGGRVTELVARPLFNLFYPELSGIVQPLSGEYAGRRSALQQMPFYTGYGVETGLLLSIVGRYGISGIAQSDLRQRIHHNQPLGALSRMSFAIIQVFMDHLERRQKVDLLSEINRTMKIIRYEQNSFSLQEHAISDRRRPPIITLPEYRQRHGITDWNPDEFAEYLAPDLSEEEAGV